MSYMLNILAPWCIYSIKIQEHPRASQSSSLRLSYVAKSHLTLNLRLIVWPNLNDWLFIDLVRFYIPGVENQARHANPRKKIWHVDERDHLFEALLQTQCVQNAVYLCMIYPISFGVEWLILWTSS